MPDEPQTTTKAPAKAPEFPTDEHRANHVLALKREAESYKQKAEGAEKSGNETGAELYKGRAAQADDELRRLADSARRGSQQAARR